MPVFDTQNSQGTYTAPEDAAVLRVRIVGGRGSGNGFDNGLAGDLIIEIEVGGGETFTYYVGESPSGQTGAQSPLGNGGDGGNAAGADASPGGGGGSPSGIEDSTGTMLGRADGSGGAGGFDADFEAGGGGGGGALGGAGGAGGTDIGSGGGEDGQPADGSGNGGDGGNGGAGDQSTRTAGQDGGTYADGGVTVESTGASTDAPQVEIVPRAPPLPPNDIRVTDERATELDVAWEDVDDTTDGVDNAEDGFRVYYSTADNPTWPGDYTQGASVGADVESATLTDLRNGERYRIVVEAFNDHGTATTEANTA